ncbi:MAG: substrate-binding domain-containing protein [Ruminococcus sp.]|nr:substrate-binding domain-containing protein [Ruminococcus sp.]
MKKLDKTNIVIIALLLVIVGCCGYAAVKYLTVDKSMIGSEADRTADPYNSYGENVNVMLSRPDNWKKIASKSLLTHEQFAGIDGSTATIPITAELARQFGNVSDDDVRYYVSHNMTDKAYENLIEGKQNRLSWGTGELDEHHFEISESVEEIVRLVFATPPSEDEYNSAREHGVTLDAEPIALDGFVFITHKDNPVDSLTVQQIKDIYSGKITNWKEVGGNDEKIRPFQRTKNSGSQTAMEELVMQGEPMTEAPVAFIAEAMGELVDAVAEYENETAAIGYTYYYYINNLYKNEDIKVLKIDGVSPDNENLVSKKYPFTAAYYAVIRGDEPQDSVYRALRDYMLTDEGQEIVRLAGYCPVKG